MKDEYRGKWKVVELTNNIVKANGLEYEDAMRYAITLHRRSPCYDDGEALYQYDVQPSRKRKQ